MRMKLGGLVMNRYFDIKDKIYHITEKYPETIDVFVTNGFEQMGDEKMRRLWESLFPWKWL